MPTTPVKGRVGKEKEAVDLAERLNKDWEAAKDVAVTSPQPTAAELEAISPERVNDSSMDITASNPSPYDAGSNEASPPQEGQLKGRQAEFYSSEQALHNMMLKAAVQENEELLTTLHEIHGEQVASARQLLAQRNRNRSDRVKEFDEGYRFPDSLGFSEGWLIEDMRLRITEDRLGLLGDIRHPQITPILALQEELLQSKLKQQRRQAAQEETVDLLACYIQQGSAPADLASGALHFHDLIHTDVFAYTKAELAKTGVLMTDLVQEVEREEANCAEAVHMEQVTKASEHRMRGLSILERICSLVRERIDLIMGGAGDGGAFRTNVTKCRDQMLKTIEGPRALKAQLRQDILADLEELAGRGDREAKHAEAEAAKYERYMHESNDKLNALAHKQDAMWEKIQDIVGEIKELGEQRAEEVARHIQATELEEKRKREYAEFSQVFASHGRRMEEALKNTETALKTLDSFTSFVGRASQIADEMNVEEELSEMRFAELRRYLEFFRRYVLLAGDMMQRRRTRLSGISRSLRNIDVQMELCTESFDPNRAMYREQHEALSVQQRETRKNLQDLQSRYEEQAALFKPTQDLLDDAGVDYVPPQLEKDEQEAQQREKHINVQKRVARAEQEEVEAEQTLVRRVQQNNRVAKEDHAKRKEHRAQKLALTPGAAGHPTSPPASPSPTPGP
eukprot:TRINITY_DN10438_c0_g1_i2.p1 TRINITY_DN10438_c0_g1~~TRINITY_DN10438_c0_g1_i2.p1  ORF type:complete len:702 (+),score=286.76 TRINITY_DN10438_c0_g1_i2:61-2106(+)